MTKSNAAGTLSRKSVRTVRRSLILDARKLWRSCWRRCRKVQRSLFRKVPSSWNTPDIHSRNTIHGRSLPHLRSELFHDRTSILIIRALRRQRGALWVAFALKPKTADTPAPRPALLPIILVGHVGPCRSDTDGFGCYPTRVADIVGPSGCTAEGPPRVAR